MTWTVKLLHIMHDIADER